MNDLATLSNAQRMLAEAKTLDELRDVRDFAEGAKAWAKARGLGIEAENQASEVVLRAERTIGRMLLDARAAGEIASVGGTISFEVLIKSLGLPTLADILPDVDVHYIADWQRAARLADDKFEFMIEAALKEGRRIAKTNFYGMLANAEKRAAALPKLVETPEDKDFVAFRQGAYGLLGWEVSEAGGSATRNGLLNLPSDELVQVAEIIKALAVAYTEARGVR